MSTMTRLPSESNLPFGIADPDMRLPFPGLSTDSSASIISPLALPRGGYFDLSTASSASHPTGASNQVYSPLSPNVRGPAVAQPPQFLSPHISPITREVQYQLQQQRSTSLPPSYRGANPAAAGGRRQSNLPVSPSGLRASSVSSSNTTLPSISSVSAGHPRSVSADAASAPSHVQMIRRLVQQNARIREAWEAERKYMEANRERAEEVYKEERALMEEERSEWEVEKATLLQEVERLQQLVLSYGGDPRQPRDTALTDTNTQNLRGGGIMESSPESMKSSHSSRGSGQQREQGTRSVVWTGNLPRFQENSGTMNGIKPPKSGDTISPSEVVEADSGPVPVVDIQEIHPELEGIPIKATSVQKSTFTDGVSQKSSKSSSPATSPPTATNRPRVSSQGSNNEHTLQVLAAPEPERLTMHAGHTPSHSLSHLPTISATTTASSSGDSTPTMAQADGTSSKGLDPIPENSFQSAVENWKSNLDSQQDNSKDHPEPVFEAHEDPELRGPLMVRNMPAHDEIFFRRLSDKLEEVQKDTRAALPAVLKGCDDIPEFSLTAKPDTNEESSVSQESGSEKEGSPKSSDGEELDIPLKIKRSFNFGAPLGEFR
ncbi:hypothetical protein V8F20_004885 [Naviculisporaceae sp. PSN 640]